MFLFFEVFAVRGEGEKLKRSKTSPKIHPKNLGGFAPWRFKKFASLKNPYRKANALRWMVAWWVFKVLAMVARLRSLRKVREDSDFRLRMT